MCELAALQGRTVLLVEDESLVSMLAEDVLLDAGCDVLLAMRLADALRIASEAEFDVAVLDINLGGGETSYPVAELLSKRGIPFVLATGYDRDGIDQRFNSCRWVQKPYAPRVLLQEIAAVAK